MLGGAAHDGAHREAETKAEDALLADTQVDSDRGWVGALPVEVQQRYAAARAAHASSSGLPQLQAVSPGDRTVHQGALAPAPESAPHRHSPVRMDGAEVAQQRGSFRSISPAQTDTALQGLRSEAQPARVLIAMTVPTQQEVKVEGGGRKKM